MVAWVIFQYAYNICVLPFLYDYKALCDKRDAFSFISVFSVVKKGGVCGDVTKASVTV